jgi:hypothetical protein
MHLLIRPLDRWIPSTGLLLKSALRALPHPNYRKFLGPHKGPKHSGLSKVFS